MLEEPYLPPYYNPGAEDEAVAYALERRGKLGGYPVPSRRTTHILLHLPDDSAYAQVKKGSGKQNVATTMAFVRLLKDLMRDKEFGPRIVPIIPDEARTFGMDSSSRRSRSTTPRSALHLGRRRPDARLPRSPRRARSSTSASTRRLDGAVHRRRHVVRDAPDADDPDHLLLMFGFQRTADSIWAAADQMTRGFHRARPPPHDAHGEGLQHADGHSHLLAAFTNPAVRAYDPAFAYEIAHIMQDGLHRMYGGGDFTPTSATSSTTSPSTTSRCRSLPSRRTSTGRILRGMYLYAPAITDGLPGDAPRVQLLASGVGMPWALEAQELLGDDWGVPPMSGRSPRGTSCDVMVWRVTSRPTCTRRRAAGAVGDPEAAGDGGPVVAVSDWMRPFRTRSVSGCPVTTAHSGPMASASGHPTGGAPGLPHRWTVDGREGAADARRPGKRSRPTPSPGDREVQVARCHGRHVGQLGRRRLTCTSRAPHGCAAGPPQWWARGIRPGGGRGRQPDRADLDHRSLGATS